MIERYEGGYGWSRADPGGPTKFGITCFDLAAHRHMRMDSMSRWAPIVAAMPLTEAEDIYAEKYATATHFNDMISGPDCCVFDFGVNSGPSRAIKYAQGIVGTTADGIIGPITLNAINRYDPVKFVVALCARRMAFLRALGTWPTFGVGWTRRVTDLQKYCTALAAAAPAPVADGPTPKATLINSAHPKAYHAEDLTLH